MHFPEMMSESLRGHFLIATKQIQDSTFFKTVVLVVEHETSGTMGLVINRPSSVTVAHALAEHFQLPETDDRVFVGGPVEPTALFILHNAEQFSEHELPIIPDLYVGSSAEAFENVVRTVTEGDSGVKFRIFSGCAGWAPGQLEAEIERGDWYHYPASNELLFHDDPYEVWDLALERVLAVHRILPHTTNHPEWN